MSFKMDLYCNGDNFDEVVEELRSIYDNKTVGRVEVWLTWPKENDDAIAKRHDG